MLKLFIAISLSGILCSLCLTNVPFLLQGNLDILNYQVLLLKEGRVQCYAHFPNDFLRPYAIATKPEQETPNDIAMPTVNGMSDQELQQVSFMKHWI